MSSIGSDHQYQVDEDHYKFQEVNDPVYITQQILDFAFQKRFKGEQLTHATKLRTIQDKKLVYFNP